MREVSRFASDDPAFERIHSGAAELFQRLAVDWTGERSEIGAIERFLAPLRK